MDCIDESGLVTPQHAPLPEVYLKPLVTELLKQLVATMSEPSVDQEGMNKYLDLNDFLVKKRPTASQFGQELRSFYEELRNLVPPAARSSHMPIDVVPAKPASGSPLRLQLGIWQLVYGASGLMRGPPPTCEVATVLQKILLDPEGLNTVKYPVDVVFDRGGLPLQPSSPVEVASIGLSVGATTITAAYYVLTSVMEAGLFQRREFSGGWFQPSCQALIRALMSCFEIHAQYDPADSFELQIMKSIKTKSAAANRARPTVLQLLTAFGGMISHSGTSGRRSKEELIHGAVTRYNRVASVKTEQINLDEINALKFLVGRNNRFLEILRGIWNGDKVMYTSTPLSLLSAPYLQPGAVLPVTKKDNPAWYDILTPSDAKFEAFLRRVDGKFQYKVAETQLREKKPNLRNFSASYRDPEAEREYVWRISCLWVASLPAQALTSRRQSVEARSVMFYSGQLDEDLKGKVKALDPSFKFEDLRYIREEVSAAQSHVTLASDAEVSAALADAELAQQMASLEVFKLKLKNEGAAFSDYRLRLEVWEDASEEQLRNQRVERLNAIVAAVDGFATVHFPVECLESFTAIPSWLDQKYQRLCQLSSIGAQGQDVPLRVEVVSFSALGQQFSVKLAEAATKVAASLSALPVISCCLVILPNTPVWGSGGQGKRLTVEQFDSQVNQARRDVLAEFSKPEHGLSMREVWALFDKSIYSPSRSLQCPVLLLVSDARDASGQLSSKFCKGLLWKRAAIPEPVPAMRREDFKNWSLDVGNPGVMDQAHYEAAERRQWNSGVPLWKMMLESLFDRVPTSARAMAQIREWTLNDDCLAWAVMEMTMEAKRGNPGLSYSGATFAKFVKNGGGIVVKANVEAAIKDRLAHLYRLKKLSFPGCPMAPDGPLIQTSGRPAPPENFEVCQPVSEHLPVKQSAIDAFVAAKTEVQRLLARTVKGHDDVFNPSGVPWKPKRLADVSLDAMPEAKSVRIPPLPGAPARVEDLQGPVMSVPGPSPALYDLLADQKGQLFLKGRADGVALKTQPLFQVRGKYLLGNPATAAMAGKSSWIEYLLDAQSLIMPTTKVEEGSQLSIKAEPTVLSKFLQDLERAGHVQPKLRLHAIDREKLNLALLAIQSNCSY